MPRSATLKEQEFTLTEKQDLASNWFRSLRDQICNEFEKLETELTGTNADKPVGKFERKKWDREAGGGGEMSMMKGRVFEKVGVNISTVFGEFSDNFKKEIPGADQNPKFWASGVSLVAHMHSPLVPAVHMNTRFVVVGEPENPSRAWFGGGADLNPAITNEEDKKHFHNTLKSACDKADPTYYDKYTKWCDEYFFNKHRNEIRGVGGIFYDYLDTNNWGNDFAFTQNVGKAFIDAYVPLVRKHMNEKWTEEQKHTQLVKRGRYAEYNLVYDRGTRFGFMTGGNTEAILMSLPPVAIWP